MWRLAIAGALTCGAAWIVLYETGPAAVGALYIAAVAIPLAAVDLRERRLPNVLVLPGFAFAAVGAVWAWLARGSPPGTAVACAVGVLLVTAALGAHGAIGMGDVKLASLLAGSLAAVAGERGPPPFGEAFSPVVAVVGWMVVSAVASGALGLAALMAGRCRDEEIPLGPILLAAFGVVAVAVVGAAPRPVPV